MENIIAVKDVNIIDWLTIAFIIIAAIISIINMIEKFSQLIGKPVKWIRQKTEDHELLLKTAKSLDILQAKESEDKRQSVRHDEMICDDLDKLSATVEALKSEIVLMRTQRDSDKLAEYKDKIGESYRFYHARRYSDAEPVPYWNHMEKEALEGLIAQYEVHGGENSFVHSVVEKEMQTWKLSAPVLYDTDNIEY